MYLRRNIRRKGGVEHEYWTLVKTERTEKGPRQQIVATVGKLAGEDDEDRIGWEHIADILNGRHRHPEFNFTDKKIPEPPQWANVDISRARAERLRKFGDVYLGSALWHRLKLDEFFNNSMQQKREDIPWSKIACILTLARFCAPSSELQISDSWYSKTALDDLVGVPTDKVNDDRLYRGLDALLPLKDGIFNHLKQQYSDLFGLKFDILLYDITSTYFEGEMDENPMAKRGYSRDSRPDCVQVCIGLVVTPEGFPLTYEIFDGNRLDVTTVEDMIQIMREKYGHERRIWVMDRGMVSEDNLEELREIGASYLVGTRKAVLKKFEKDLLDRSGWTQVKPDVEVKLCKAPDDSTETFVLCRSKGRSEKEKAMRERQIKGIEDGLEKIKIRLASEKYPLRNRDKVNRMLGRLFHKYSRAAHLYNVTVKEEKDSLHKDKIRLSLRVKVDDTLSEWAKMSDGCYLLRTNLQDVPADKLWRMYMGLTTVEESFRITKSDLGLRPVFHQKEDRTKAHILVCFLALVMWRTLEEWMRGCGLGNSPRKLLEEMAEVRSLDIVLPIKSGKDIRLRVVGKPEKHLMVLLHKLRLPLPNKAKMLQNVVETLGIN